MGHPGLEADRVQQRRRSGPSATGSRCTGPRGRRRGRSTCVHTEATWPTNGDRVDVQVDLRVARGPARPLREGQSERQRGRTRAPWRRSRVGLRMAARRVQFAQHVRPARCASGAVSRRACPRSERGRPGAASGRRCCAIVPPAWRSGSLYTLRRGSLAATRPRRPVLLQRPARSCSPTARASSRRSPSCFATASQADRRASAAATRSCSPVPAELGLHLARRPAPGRDASSGRARSWRWGCSGRRLAGDRAGLLARRPGRGLPDADRRRRRADERVAVRAARGALAAGRLPPGRGARPPGGRSRSARSRAWRRSRAARRCCCSRCC